MARPVSAIPREDIPFHAFQKRLGAGELRTPELNDQNRRLYHLPSQMVVREAYVADRESVRDSFQGEWLKYWPVREGK
jgi:hypothetical protein